MDEQQYQDFFDHFRKFKEMQNRQKARGLNDFNLLTTVLKYDDEVRLHSRMIGTLLDPNAKHYQGNLFLAEFLKAIELDKWGLNLDNAKVYVEYHDIDLYITDGTKHIIIENKIWAKDQPCQLIKYINIIKEEYDLKISEVDADKILKIEDIYTIYLTPRDKECPSEHKIEQDGEDKYIMFSGDRDKLKECSKRENTKKLVPNGLENYQTKYKQITYQYEIVEWLNCIHSEVRNILNLSEAIKQYTSVVEIVIDKYKGNVMSLEEYLRDNKTIYENISDVKLEIDKLQTHISQNFWEELEKNLKIKLKLSEETIKKATKYEGKEFEYNEKKISIVRDHNLYINIYDIKSAKELYWNYIKIDQAYNQSKNDLIDMKNGNKNFWKLGDDNIRTKLISNIIDYIKKNI